MKLFRKIREYVPIKAIAVFSITIISGIILLIEKIFASFADFINMISAPFRMAIAWSTSWIPFSLAEILVIAIPVWLTAFIVIGIKRSKSGLKSTVKYISIILCIPCFIFITFVWTYSSGYYNSELYEKLEFEDIDIGKNELYETSLWLKDNLNIIADHVRYGEDNGSFTNDSYDLLSKKIYHSYSKVSDKYDIIYNFPSRIKPIMLSEPMTYTFISGVYTFMTGEANLNVNYPDFVCVSSLAHEFAHQRGIAREEEANFISFLVCTSSDDDFIRYSGYLDAFLNVSSALRKESNELYNSVIASLDKRVIKDIISYSEFCDKYKDTIASDVADSVNDKFLQANGQEQGIKSYGMVTKLCVGYFYTEIKK